MDISDKKALLLDIEGTTTSINFVKDVLFDYARKNVSTYLTNHFEEDEVQETIEQFRSQIEKDVEEGVEGMTILPSKDNPSENIVASLVSNVLAMMDSDRKLGPLKQLQGMIWKDAYEEGLIKGHVYDDVVPALEKWKEESKDIYIYSSGSVQAQKLLFRHSVKGNILHYFKGHFDTSIGLKVCKKSYEAIAKNLRFEPESILFITDIVKEAIAAKEAGMDVVLSVRPENKPLDLEESKEFPVIYSFMNFYQDKTEECPKNKTKRKVENVSSKNEERPQQAKVLKKY